MWRVEVLNHVCELHAMTTLERTQSWNPINRLLYRLNQSRLFIRIKHSLKILDHEISGTGIRMNKHLRLTLSLRSQLGVQSIKGKSKYKTYLLQYAACETYHHHQF